jgi:hypothetical protein
MKTNIAYLSMDTLENFECYDSLTYAPMRDNGYEVSEVAWRDTIDWSTFEYVIVRSSWDYQDEPDTFMNVLDNINNSPATLINPLSIIKWNINKRYLRDLAKNGVVIVPTIWGNTIDNDLLGNLASLSNEIIIKPAVSANADDTYRVNTNELQEFIINHGGKFNNREFLIQPFIKAIISEGEYSLFYFNGKLSHCILKTPKQDDFRVQEEHGGRLKLIKKPERCLLDTGQFVLNAIPQKLLYARLDFVRHHDEFLLMEAELIEPSLYFNLDPDSPVRFANAFDAYIKALN